MLPNQPIPNLAINSEIGALPIPGPSNRFRLFACLASVLIPGVGQLLLRQYRRAIYIFVVFLLIIAMYWPVRLPRYYWGIIALIWSMCLLAIFAGCDILLRKNASQTKLSRWWLFLVLPLTVLGLVIFSNLFIRGAGFRLFIVPSTSMENTILVNDELIADLHYYRLHPPSSGDLVILTKNHAFLVKRIIAVANSTIEGKNGDIFVDRSKLHEIYIKHIGDPPPELNDFGPITVPQGKFFVLGDNRDVSYDSREPEFGLVDTKEIVGKPLYLSRPLSRAGVKLR